jgi:ABC-type glycerol-3-phosphate transport system substrate-binding protein
MLTDTPTENDGMGGLLIDTSWQTAVSWLNGFEGGILEQNDYRFLTPNNIKAFTFLKESADMGCAWKPAPDADVYAAFANRQALFASAALEDFPSQSRAFADANNGDVWTVMPYPENGLIVYGSSYVMLKSTPEKQFATWLFMRWLLEPEQDAKLVEATHLFPIRKSSVDLLSDYMKSHLQWVSALNLLPDAAIQPQLVSWRSVKVMIGDGFDSMFRVDVLSGRVAEILAKMESTSRELSK